MGRTATALVGAILALVGMTGTPAAGQPPQDPTYSVDTTTLDAAQLAGTTAADQPLARVEAAPSLPATGRAIPILAAGIAIGVALLLRAGRSHFDDDDDVGG